MLDLTGSEADTALNVCKAWGLSDQQTEQLSYDPPELERISLVLGIHKALRILFPHEQQGNA